MTGRRVWCFLVHRWWVPTVVTYGDNYDCIRCGERWTRA